METTEIIAELRKAVAVGDSPVFCGGSFISKRVAMEAADRLEALIEELADRRKDIEVLLESRSSGDLISRSALMYDMGHRQGCGCSCADCEKINCLMGEVIEAAPAVEAEPVVHARWTFESLSQIAPNCSNCRMQSIMRYPRCPHCGAHMDEEVAHE